MPQMYFIAEAFPSILETVCTTPLHLPLLFLYRNYLFAYRNTVAMPLQYHCNYPYKQIEHFPRICIKSFPTFSTNQIRQQTNLESFNTQQHKKAHKKLPIKTKTYYILSYNTITNTKS